MKAEKRKICFVSGTRADYGILSTIMRRLEKEPGVELQLAVTNMHLDSAFGATYKEIEADGFKIDRKVMMNISGDNPIDSVKAVGEGCSGFAEAFSELNPDLIVVLGDRYELLAVCSAATILGIPIAHLHGGEITEGAVDDQIRHAVTKLSYLHFTSTEEYRNRVIQMGEAPDRVYYVGSPSIENIDKSELLSLKELESDLKFPLGEKFLIVTYHPVTKEPLQAESQVNALLRALEKFVDFKLLFTLPNSDSEGRLIANLINDWCDSHSDRAIAVKSLGRKRFFSALNYATAMIGNSSSGLIEAPVFMIPTLNIGNRQKERAKGNTVVDCEATEQSIVEGLQTILSESFIDNVRKEGKNPYYKKGSVDKIVEVLLTYPVCKHPAKHFYDIK